MASQNWRLHNLYYISDIQGREILFKPNNAQRKFLSEFQGWDIILKARQLGFTTLIAILGLDEALFSANWAVAIIAHTREDAEELFETKVKYPYSHLPSSIKRMVSARNDTKGMYRFSNGSSIRVTASVRSGTVQRLHVSEFGKICALFPQKAREIVSGSLPAAHNNDVTLESTAEGCEGPFFKFCQKGMLGEGRFKFHFYAWWQNPVNIWSGPCPKATPANDLYFSRLEKNDGISLSKEQKNWWLLTQDTLGADMMREHPSTPQEAFDQAIEGAYFADQLAFIEAQGQISVFPFDNKYPVNTFWDLGRNDQNTIWLHQEIHSRNIFLKYYENSGENISHYVRWLQDWQLATGAIFGKHYWPHDGKREDEFILHPFGRQGVAEDLGLKGITIVDRPVRKLHAVEITRARLTSCHFDKEGCGLGLQRLRHYRRKWNPQTENYTNEFVHDINSHGADGLMTFACGYNGNVYTKNKGPIVRKIGTMC